MSNAIDDLFDEIEVGYRRKIKLLEQEIKELRLKAKAFDLMC